jgi:hypothetical protein
MSISNQVIKTKIRQSQVTFNAGVEWRLSLWNKWSEPMFNTDGFWSQEKDTTLWAWAELSLVKRAPAS